MNPLIVASSTLNIIRNYEKSIEDFKNRRILIKDDLIRQNKELKEERDKFLNRSK